MDSLPDDLMLAILGLLEDGRTLLDVVPLVCRRWRRLSWHPEAWAGVVLCWQPCHNSYTGDYSQCTDDDHADVDQSARVLLHAPALRSFFVGDYTWESEVCSYEVRRLRSATLRTEAAVRDVWLGDQLWYQHLGDVDGMEDALLGFIARCHGSLRFLELSNLASSPRLEDTLCRLDRLESLGLDLYQAYNRSGSSGALRSALPRLERLQLLDWTMHVDDGIAEMMADLVVGAAATLRTLRLIHCHHALPPVFVAALRRCQRLRQLACGVAAVGMLVAVLPQLATLELRLRFVSTAATFAAAADALSGCSVAGLRCLRLDLQGWSPSKWSQFLRLVEALANAAPSLRVLDVYVTGGLFLDGDFAVPFVTLVVVKWRGLRSVKLDRCSVDVVRRLAALPFLEDLSATVSCLREECSCVADVAALQRQWPALRMALRVHQH